MKLNDIRPTIETSGDLEEQLFSIQDTGMIFDILRNKMYSNPILAICREITCNARDAHREVGIATVPIHIYLPNNIEQYYKVKDFGPGISPDRMSNIFIKYTASTKRNDNMQTGGFGLGAKTPFSYSDSFSIVTNFDGIQYNYSCNIDETKVGKLMLMSQSPTTEKNGTEIKIPVKAKNYSEFATWTEQACRHWDVKPIIKGGTITWQENKKILEGNKWAITASQDWQRHARMIIDGIEYPLELDSLKKYADAKLIDAAKGHFIMYFGVGELSLSASRENIYLDERTQNIIRARLDGILKEIKKTVTDKIDTMANLWDANIYYRKELKSAFNNLTFLGVLSWNGIALGDSHIQTGCPTFHFSKGKYSRKFGTDPNKLTRSNNAYLSFDQSSALYINDLTLKEPTPRHVKKAFEDDPTLLSVQIVCPNDKITLASLEKSISLDKMAPKLLSSITKASARSYTPATSRLLIFKFDNNANAFRQVSYASIEEDTNKKVLCSLVKENSYSSHTRQVYLKNKKCLNLSAIKTLIGKFPGYSFYGADEDAPKTRLDEDFSDFEDIEVFIKDNVLNNKNINYVQIKFATTNSYHLDERLLKIYNKMQPLITNKNSLYLKRLELHGRIKAINTGDLGLLSIYESVNGNIDEKEIKLFLKAHPEFDIDSINDDYAKLYPLLNHINIYNYSEITAHVAQYVNIIDKV
jgi:hypothetical protein